jgi:hypothetical protein
LAISIRKKVVAKREQLQQGHPDINCPKYITPPKGPTFKMFFKNLNFRRKMFFSNLTMGQILNRNGEGMNRRKWKLKNSCQILKN